MICHVLRFLFSISSSLATAKTTSSPNWLPSFILNVLVMIGGSAGPLAQQEVEFLELLMLSHAERHVRKHRPPLILKLQCKWSLLLKISKWDTNITSLKDCKNSSLKWNAYWIRCTFFFFFLLIRGCTWREQ